jgi:hypothetical protein
VNWLSAITAVSRLFSSLTGLFRDWRLRRAGASEARLSALEAAQARAKRMVEVAADIDGLDDDELDRRLRHYRRTSSRVRMD